MIDLMLIESDIKYFEVSIMAGAMTSHDVRIMIS